MGNMARCSWSCRMCSKTPILDQLDEDLLIVHSSLGRLSKDPGINGDGFDRVVRVLQVLEEIRDDCQGWYENYECEQDPRGAMERSLAASRGRESEQETRLPAVRPEDIPRPLPEVGEYGQDPGLVITGDGEEHGVDKR